MCYECRRALAPTGEPVRTTPPCTVALEWGAAAGWHSQHVKATHRERHRASRHFGFGRYSAHQAFGLILPSTTLHESGGSQCRQLSHC